MTTNEELRELYELATKGPFEAAVDESGFASVQVVSTYETKTLTADCFLRPENAHLIAAMHNELPRLLAEAPGWRPMSTAPMDGTWLILDWPHWSVAPVLGYWNDGWESDARLSLGPDPVRWSPLPDTDDPLVAERDALKAKLDQVAEWEANQRKFLRDGSMRIQYWELDELRAALKETP